MPSPKGAYIWLDLSAPGPHTTGTAPVSEAVSPVDGTIKEIWVGASVLPTAGTLAAANGGVNILSATNVNLASDIAAGVGEALDLAAAGALEVKAGDILSATWTLTTLGSFVGGSLLVGILPTTW